MTDIPERAIRTILDYLYEEEGDYWGRDDEEEREGHIFNDIKEVANWLETLDNDASLAAAKRPRLEERKDGLDSEKQVSERALNAVAGASTDA
jgi:hypothetical protein